MFKINNKDPVVNFEHIPHLVLVFLLLISSREMLVGNPSYVELFDIHGSKKTTHPMYTLPGISNSIGMKLNLGPVIAFLETETIYDVIFLVR